MATATLTSVPAVIEKGIFYPLAIFQGITGYGSSAMRQARRAGLKVRYLHGRAGVVGDDFFVYLDLIDAEQADG